MKLGDGLIAVTEELHVEVAGAKRSAKAEAAGESPTIKRNPTNGRFVAGTKGGGRPPGGANAATRARALLANHAEELVALALDKVRNEGSSALLSDLLRFSLPQMRSQLQAVMIPAAAEAMAAGDFDRALAEITQAALNGEISADTAKITTEQVRAAEEAKRLKHVESEINRLSEKVINGFAKRIC